MAPTPDLEPIRRNSYPQADRAAVEEKVAALVEANPEPFFSQYNNDPRSFDGRYIAADLFKETFADYRASKEARNRYNAPVHNSAAVLAAAQLRLMLKTNLYPQRDTVVFLTGIPGAGKTSSVLASGQLPFDCRAIFEGQLSNPDTTNEKLQQVLDAGLKPKITVVHATPEDALLNTLKRFSEQGRGASINVMSTIQGGLPESLQGVSQRFGQAVEFSVYDYRDRARPVILSGWNNLAILRSEGDHERIKQRLGATLESLRRSGSITAPAYEQAIGSPLRTIGLESNHHGQHDPDVSRRSLPPGNSEKPIVMPRGRSR